MISLAEDCIETLLYAASERFFPGVGVISLRDILRREVVQQLCVEPSPHSLLAQLIPKTDRFLIEGFDRVLEEVLKEVAEIKQVFTFFFLFICFLFFFSLFLLFFSKTQI